MRAGRTRRSRPTCAPGEAIQAGDWERATGYVDFFVDEAAVIWGFFRGLIPVIFLEQRGAPRDELATNGSDAEIGQLTVEVLHAAYRSAAADGAPMDVGQEARGEETI
ncbi:hypothetical protein BH24CHL9_BH24CHL9_02140 [soil metagenome]